MIRKAFLFILVSLMVNGLPFSEVMSDNALMLELNPRTIKLYVSKGIYIPPDQARRVLLEAVRSKDPETVVTVLKSLKTMYWKAKVPQNLFEIINATDAHGFSPLAYAAIYGSRDIAHLLLEYGADPNRKDNYGSTPLMHAVLNDHPDVVDLLIDYGARVNEKGGVHIKSFRVPGGSALMAAVLGGSVRCVKKLISMNANLEDEDDSGKTALMYAAAQGYLGIVKLLVDAGSKLDHKDEFGRTALVHAIIHRHPSIVKFLLNAGANVNIQDIQHLTPLQYAFSVGDRETRMLVSYATTRSMYTFGLSKSISPSGY